MSVDQLHASWRTSGRVIFRNPSYRRVVGWAMKAEMTAQFVTDALIMAISGEIPVFADCPI
jgi:hypothetical protein